MTPRDPHTDPLGDALRSLPRHRAGDRFTERVLDRLARAEAAPRFPAALRLAAAGLLLGAAILGGFAAGLLLPDGAGPSSTEPRAAVPAAARPDARRPARRDGLRAERARLAAELAELRRLTTELAEERGPVLYLGGDEEVDLVLDLGRLAQDGSRDPGYRFTTYDQEVDRP